MRRRVEVSPLAFWLTLSVILTAAAPGARALVMNGDFASGLDGWTSAGDVTVTAAEEARLADTSSPLESYLLQPVALLSGLYTLGFDFDVSGFNEPPFMNNAGGFSDLFSVSVFTTADPSAFDITAFGNPAVAVLDHDSSGTVVDPFGDLGGAVSLTASAVKGGSWRHVNAAFVHPGGFAVPAFELFDDNDDLDSTTTNDASLVRIDNVTIAAAASVPEPSSALLVGAGLLVLAARALEKRKGRGGADLKTTTNTYAAAMGASSP